MGLTVVVGRQPGDQERELLGHIYTHYPAQSLGWAIKRQSVQPLLTFVLHLARLTVNQPWREFVADLPLQKSLLLSQSEFLS
jgi:hypothetical protein